MTTFDQFKERVYSRKIYLAEVWTGIHLQDFTKTGGYSYVYEFPIVEVPELNHLPIIEEVIENDGTAYTSRATVALVEANAGSYFFDRVNKKVYIHTTGSDDPDGTTAGIFDYTIVANFWLRFGSDGLIFNSKYYYPRISQNGLSDLTVSSRTIFFGIQTTGNGSLRLRNEDKFFDKLLKQYLWTNREIYILLGGDEMEYSVYATVFKGSILDWQAGDTETTLTIKDHRAILSNKIPPNVYDQAVYSALPDADVGKPIPLIYGYVTGAAGVKVGTTGKGVYKLSDHALHQILKVYNNGTDITTQITRDLANGQFTIGGGYGGTPGTLTADVAGLPLAATADFFSDSFSDNVISDWDQSSSGGAYSWAASGGRVAGSCSAAYVFLTHPLKMFTDGVLQVKINSSGYNGLGIVFDYTDHNNFKAAYLYYSAALWRVRIISVLAGVETQRTNDTVTLAGGTDYTLKLVLSKNGLATPYLDGVAKTAFNFVVPFTPGKVGLFMKSTSSGYFDDFLIQTDYLQRGAEIVKDICVNRLGIDEDDIDTDSFDDSNLKAPQILSTYISSQVEAASVIEKICHSNLCRFVVAENGKVHYSFWDSDDESLETIQAEEILGDYKAEEKESEVYTSCIVKYGQGASTQIKIKTWGDPRTAYLYKKGTSKEFETYLSIDDDAADLAFRLFQLLRTPATRYTFKTKMKTLNGKIGDVITLKRNRGISISGKHNTDLRIVGLTKNFSRTEVRVEAVPNSTALGEALCEVTCQQPCETSCQSTCELDCMETCEVYCEGTCKINCKVGCMVNCTTTCQTGGCEVVCQGCESACESGICQTTCELDCQTACELGCLSGCQQACTDFCLLHCMIGGEE